MEHMKVETLDTRLPEIAKWGERKRDHFPLAIPDELAPELMRFHGNPAAWWIGQIIAYMFRPQPFLISYINDVKEKIGFKKPIVGVHIRRTDKIGREAESYSIKQYMDVVDEYYKKRGTVDKRRVFLATDDPSAVQTARQQYPNYVFINDLNTTELADPKTRYTFTSLLGLVTDIFLLAESDFLVCTFSSNVGRAAFELMQTLNVDASHNARSLDTIFHFYGENKHFVKVIQTHNPWTLFSKEFALNPGDKIWLKYLTIVPKGFFYGHNEITGTDGFFPSSKVEDIIKTVNYSTKFTEM